jgi:hypothetical protein
MPPAPLKVGVEWIELPVATLGVGDIFGDEFLRGHNLSSYDVKATQRTEVFMTIR